MIGVITYDTYHRKTQDILIRLYLTTNYKVKIFILPWKERENFQPIWKHRPELNFDANPDLLAKKFGYTAIRLKSSDLNNVATSEGVNVFLIAGAGI